MFDLNLQQALKKDRDKLISTRKLESLIDDFHSQRMVRIKQIEESLNKKSDLTPNNLIFDELELKNIFHIDSIKKLCIRYRLRFLDTSLFMGDYPSELYKVIPKLEQIHNTKFKTMALAVYFDYEDEIRKLMLNPYWILISLLVICFASCVVLWMLHRSRFHPKLLM